MKKVVVGMSGGVDSSVAAYLLKEQGYEVIGITFKFLKDADTKDAEKVCQKLNIEHHILDYTDIFKIQVIDKFISDYKSGITPNPCVMCNKTVKIKFLYDEMLKLNADYLATGHYAILKDGKLYKSSNQLKDQTYFLCEVPKYILSKTLFPLEGMDKEEVRNIASKIGLEIWNKKDSLDVCFINNSFKEYMKDTISTKEGDVVDIETNKVIGKHKGLSYYTIGQRRGLDIGGTTDRMFVVGKDVSKNILYICIGSNNDYLISDSCIIEEANYISDEKLSEATAKFRYHQQDVPVELEYLNDDKILVKYKDGVKGVTPGQACVLYNNDECLGGGIIKKVIKNNERLWYL